MTHGFEVSVLLNTQGNVYTLGSRTKGNEDGSDARHGLVARDRVFDSRVRIGGVGLGGQG